MSEEAAEVVPRATPADVRADVEDQRVLGEALQGRAALFVTGDAALRAVGSLQIVAPRRFWEILHAGAS
jgi:predicted nucleic acid-binding protein